jgi:hypothetical protein
MKVEIEDNGSYTAIKSQDYVCAIANIMSTYPAGKAMICSFCDDDLKYSKPAARELCVPHIVIRKNGIVRQYEYCIPEDFQNTKITIYVGTSKNKKRNSEKISELKRKNLRIEDMVILT